FNTGQYLELEGPIDTAAFARAVDLVTADADLLSMRIDATGSEPVVVIDPSRSPVVRIIDLRDRPDPRAAALDAMWADMRTPVDPARDPVAVEWLFTLADDHHLWYQRIHHIAIDGYGTAMIVRRVCEAYKALAAGN